MKDIILLKQGEVVLKGLNRRFFDQKLGDQHTKAAQAHGAFHVYCVQSTVYVEPEDELADMDGGLRRAEQDLRRRGRSRAPRPARRTRTP